MSSFSLFYGATSIQTYIYSGFSPIKYIYLLRHKCSCNTFAHRWSAASGWRFATNLTARARVTNSYVYLTHTTRLIKPIDTFVWHTEHIVQHSSSSRGFSHGKHDDKNPFCNAIPRDASRCVANTCYIIGGLLTVVICRLMCEVDERRTAKSDKGFFLMCWILIANPIGVCHWIRAHRIHHYEARKQKNNNSVYLIIAKGFCVLGRG